MVWSSQVRGSRRPCESEYNSVKTSDMRQLVFNCFVLHREVIVNNQVNDLTTSDIQIQYWAGAIEIYSHINKTYQ